MAAGLRSTCGAARSAIELVGVNSERTQRRLRARLGGAGYGEALEAGAGRPDREVIQSLLTTLEVAESTAASTSSTRGRTAGPYGTLTAREREVLGYLIDGQTNADIAAHMFVSERTVHAHLRNLYEKLGTTNRAAAVRWAFDHGITP